MRSTTLSVEPPQRPRTSRIRALIELSSVVFLILVELWFPSTELWRSILLGFVVVAIVWSSHFRRGGRRNRPASQPAGRAWSETCAVTAVMAVAFWFWVRASSEPYDTIDLSDAKPSLLALCIWVGRRLVLAAIQQLLLQWFLLPTCGELVGGALRPSLLAAGLFASFHLPSTKLAIVTGIAAIVWIALYQRSRRLVPLIVAHALLAGLATTITPGRLLYDNEIGRRALDSPSRFLLLEHPDVRSLLRTVTSDQYFDGGFDSSPTAFVAGLYRDVLGRSATPEEVLYWTHDWAPESRYRVAKSLMVSAELDATRDSLWRRQVDRVPMPSPRIISPASSGIKTTGLSLVDSSWRWRPGATAEIRFGDPDADRTRVYLLELEWGSIPVANIEVALNLRPLETIDLPTSPPTSRSIVTPAVLDNERENRLLLMGPQFSARALPPDLVKVRLEPLRFPGASLVHTDDGYFLDGFSIAEQAFRWTQKTTARLVYPIRTIEAGADYTLELTAGAYGEHQPLEILFNGVPAGRWVLSGIEAQTVRGVIQSPIVLEGVNTITFLLPEAVVPDTIPDARQLGLAFMRLRLFPRPALEHETDRSQREGKGSRALLVEGSVLFATELAARAPFR